MATNKLRMSNKRFMAILIPVLVLLFAIILVVTCVMNYFAQTMDTYLGMGERQVIATEKTASWDTDYYEKRFASTSGENGSLQNSAKVSKKITDEGIVLMKNNGILPMAKNSKVTPFGYRYVNPVYGGTGSGNVDTTQSYVVTAEEGLAKYFDVNKTVADKLKAGTPIALTSTSANPAKPNDKGDGFDGADVSIFEFDKSIYDGTQASCAGSTAVVYLGRIGGEGKNLQMTPYKDNKALHALQLTDYEKDAILTAKVNCGKVVAVIDASNVMEIGELMAGEYECDAIIWIGGPGASGFDSLADIMVGNVNPSGRTVDIWERDLMASPVNVNYTEQLYTNTEDIYIAGEGNKRFSPGVYFLEYEEGLYYGYRYHETADEMDALYVYGELDADGGVKTPGAVTYPFGYGLSYTDFTQKITAYSDAGDKIKVTVAVKNTGSRDGKEVVQLYYTAPYTDFDKTNKIEKAVKNLAAFAKTDVKAGETVEVTLEFAKEDMASYCYTHKNTDGTTGCYVLENGEYTMTLGKNSHDAWDSRKTNIGATIWYDNANPRQTEKDAQSEFDEKGVSRNFPAKARIDTAAKYLAATNQFQDNSDYYEEGQATVFSRKDWQGTFPNLSERKALSDARVKEVSTFDPANDKLLGSANPNSKIYNNDAPKGGENNGLVLSDMRGLDYYDPMWETYLDQIDYSDPSVLGMIFSSAFNTREIKSLGKPKTVDLDGPQGLKLTGASGTLDACAYCSEVVVAATWNVDLAYDYGEAVGQECLTGGVNGWYAPSLNIHRSAFEGRNFEYYSEDALFSGKMAAYCTTGAADQGVVCYSKHFGMNEFENNAINTCCWANEQVMREVYLRGFEIHVKESRMTVNYIADDEGTRSSKIIRGCNAMMGAGTLMGATWGAANYYLNNNVLRGEWGFQGFVTTDMAPQGTPYVVEKAIFSGADVRMWYGAYSSDYMDSATGKNIIRRAMKNVCYTYANSNATNNLAPGSIAIYTMSPWAIWLLVANILIYAVILGGIVWILLRIRHSRKNPELYKHKQVI